MKYEEAAAVVENLTEDDGFLVLHALRRKFYWSGTMFTTKDVASTIAECRDDDGKEPSSDKELEDMVSEVLSSKDWHKWLPDYLTEKGFDYIRNVVYEMLENEYNS